MGSLDAIDTWVEIETPERVQFSYRLAGPLQRSAAYAIDLVVRVFILGILSLFALGGSRSETLGGGFSAGIWIISSFLVEWGYFIACEMWLEGQSIGKRALKLRVVKHNGLPLHFSDSVLRNLLRAADFLPGLYGLGLLCMSVDDRFRRLGDIAAGTMVVVEEPLALFGPALIQPNPGVAELAQIPFHARLSSAEFEAIEALLRRRARLNPHREDELADIVAPDLAKRVGARYSSPARFLALLYYRSLGKTGS